MRAAGAGNGAFQVKVASACASPASPGSTVWEAAIAFPALSKTVMMSFADGMGETDGFSTDAMMRGASSVPALRVPRTIGRTRVSGVVVHTIASGNVRNDYATGSVPW